MPEIAASRPAEPPRYILAPYVATPPEVVERMLDLAGVGPDDLLYDLGCGDGRIVVAAALRGAQGVGVDIEPYWVDQARANARAAGVDGAVRFEVADAMTTDVSAATVVTLYLVEWSTERVWQRLAAGLRPGARIVSHSFAVAGRDPERIDRWIDAAGAQRTLRLWTAREERAGRFG